MKKVILILAVLVLGSTLVGCSDGSDDRKCAAAAAKALQTCVSSVNTAQRECYADGDSACEDSNPDILQAHHGVAFLTNNQLVKFFGGF